MNYLKKLKNYELKKQKDEFIYLKSNEKEFNIKGISYKEYTKNLYKTIEPYIKE